MHDHGPATSEDAYSPAADECPVTVVNLPCGCQDVAYGCGYVDREHDHVVCDATRLPGATTAAKQLAGAWPSRITACA